MNLRKLVILFSLAIFAAGAIFLACSSTDEPPVIFPPTDQVDVAYISPNDAPTINGVLDQNEIWESVEKTQLISVDTSDYNPSNRLELADMMAVSDSNYLYVLVSWDDPTEDLRYIQMRWTDLFGWELSFAGFEDFFAIFFDPNMATSASQNLAQETDCFSMCHTEGGGFMVNESGTPVDGWYWRSSVTNPISRALDLDIVDSLQTDLGVQGLDAEINPGFAINFNYADTSGPLYWAIDREVDSTMIDDSTTIRVLDTGPYLLFSQAEEFGGLDVLVDTAFVPHYILYEDNSGSRWDVQARGTYDTVRKRWTVEFKRPLDTGNSDDMQFQIGDEVYIYVAYGNNRKVNHVGFDPVLLKF